MDGSLLFILCLLFTSTRTPLVIHLPIFNLLLATFDHGRSGRLHIEVIQ
jgi:hypothetical protein